MAMVKLCDGSIMLQGCLSLKRQGERRDWDWGFSQDISQDVMDRSKYQSILTRKQKSKQTAKYEEIKIPYSTIMKQSPNASQQRNGFRRRFKSY